MPLASSVVDRISTSLSNFHSPIKVISRRKRQFIVETGEEIYFSPNNSFGDRCTLRVQDTGVLLCTMYI